MDTAKEGRFILTSVLIRLFVNNYENTSNSRVRENYGRFASIVGILSNIFLFTIKVTVGTIFNSISIIADAVNNLSDSGSSVVTLAGFKISGKPADVKHPYGHERMEYVAGLIVSVIILFLGLQLIQGSVQKIMNPQATQFSMISVWVLVASILIKLWQFAFYRRIGKTIDSLTLLATSIDSRNDILATASVLIAAVISYLTGFNLDGYMGAVVAIFIMASGVNLIKETVSPLLGMAPPKELVESVYEKILGYDHILGLHDLAVHSYGVSKCFASVHCEMSAEQDILVCHEIIDRIERDFMKDMGIHMVIHLDPIITSDEKTNELKEKIGSIIWDISHEIGMHDFRVVWGKSHTNIIFDITVPHNFRLGEEELVELISNRINEIDSSYYSVIIVDHDYVPAN
jgi:cation diffusion facilitator family transporter